MNHPLYQVHAVEIVGPYTVRVQFTDDTEQIIYLKPILAGELYGPLLDLQLFNQVIVDPDMIGLSTKTPLPPEQENGNVYLPDKFPSHRPARSAYFS